MKQETKAANTNELRESGPDGAQPSSVVTRMNFAASPAQVWEGLLFYEEIDERPPLYLRLLLPVPIRIEGRKSEVGDQPKCLYEGGHILKRITRIEPGRLYEFEVAEQEISVGGGMRLSGGSFALRELEGGATEIALDTRYVSAKRPRWFWAPLERAVFRRFHRHILHAMRRKIASR